MITPNEREARFALGDQDSTLGRLASMLNEAADYQNLILKLGDRGIFCVDQNTDVKNSYFSIDSFASNVVDAVGAGDALLAYATLSMLATKSVFIASILGSVAAACECEQEGNVAISTEQVINKLNSIQELSGYKISNKA